MFPLQNQEPSFAYPRTQKTCPKKWFWQTPGGPDYGEEIFGGSESAMSSWQAQAVGESWAILVVDSISTPWLLNKEKPFLFNDDQSMMSYGDGDSKSITGAADSGLAFACGLSQGAGSAM